MASDGEPDYLRRKAENLIERIEDGRALSIILPAILLSSSSATPSPAAPKKRNSEPAKSTPKDDPAKKSKKIVAADSPVQNSEATPAWAIPPGHSYLTMFGPKMPSISGWPFFNDNRLTRLGKSRRAPMCIRFQSTGECTTGCTLAHIKPTDMADSDRNAVTKRFLAVYS
jgi:hypothetical protein